MGLFDCFFLVSSLLNNIDKLDDSESELVISPVLNTRDIYPGMSIWPEHIFYTLTGLSSTTFEVCQSERRGVFILAIAISG